jgi:hypothetical protein
MFGCGFSPRARNQKPISVESVGCRSGGSARLSRLRPAADGYAFPPFMKRGFAEIGNPGVAICLLPGTEVAFEEEVKAEPNFR